MESENQVEVFEGRLKSFTLVSKYLSFSPVPNPKDVVEQHISYFDDGRVWITDYQYNDGLTVLEHAHYEIVIGKNAVQFLFSRLEECFSIATEIPEIVDKGVWEIDLLNTEGKTFNFGGPLINGNEKLDKISSYIRGDLDWPELFCFDGGPEIERIESVKVEYNRITKVKNEKRWKETDPEYIIHHYHESLSIDRKTEAIEHVQQIGDDRELVNYYRIGAPVSYFLNIFYSEDFLDDIEGNPVDVLEDQKEKTEYKIEVTYRYRKPKHISGTYDQKGLPKDWPNFIGNICRDFFEFYGLGEIMNPSMYRKVRPRIEDKRYAVVTFDHLPYEFYYKCDDNTISEGDMVLVKIDDIDKPLLATVNKIDILPEKALPCSEKMIDSIIRKTDQKQDESLKGEEISKIVYGPSQNVFVCDRKINGTDRIASLMKLFNWCDTALYTKFDEGHDYLEKDDYLFAIKNPFCDQNIEIFISSDRFVIFFYGWYCEISASEDGFMEVISIVFSLLSNNRCVVEVRNNNHFLFNILFDGGNWIDSDRDLLIKKLDLEEEELSELKEHGGRMSLRYWNPELNVEIAL